MFRGVDERATEHTEVFITKLVTEEISASYELVRDSLLVGGITGIKGVKGIGSETFPIAQIPFTPFIPVETLSVL